MVPFPRGLMSRSVHESSTGRPALFRSQTAPPRSNYPGLNTLYPPLRRVPLQDFHFPEVFWVFLLVFKIYFSQVQFIDNVVLIFFFLSFWPHRLACLRDLSSQSRDRTHAPCRGSSESYGFLSKVPPFLEYSWMNLDKWAAVPPTSHKALASPPCPLHSLEPCLFLDFTRMESHCPSSSVSGLFTQRKDVRTLQLFAALYHQAASRRTACESSQAARLAGLASLG